MTETPAVRRDRRSPFRVAGQRLAAVLGPAVLYVLLRLLHLTLRVEFDGIETVRERWQRGEKVILTFWHGRQLAMVLAARILDQPFSVLVSQHRDGEIASQVLQRWGIETVRGSATRGGARGLLNMVRAHRDGRNLAMIPDGPKGPAEVVKPGILRLARATGGDLVPVSFAADRAWRLHSWDTMVVPKPFARLIITIGTPRRISANAKRDDLERAAAVLDDDLHELTNRAEQSVATG